jgi:hypothetical protein
MEESNVLGDVAVIFDIAVAHKCASKAELGIRAQPSKMW